MKRPMRPGNFPGVTSPDYLQWDRDMRTYDVEIVKFYNWFRSNMPKMAYELIKSGVELGFDLPPKPDLAASKEEWYEWMVQNDLHRVHQLAIQYRDNPSVMPEVNPNKPRDMGYGDVGEWLSAGSGRFVN